MPNITILAFDRSRYDPKISHGSREPYGNTLDFRGEEQRSNHGLDLSRQRVAHLFVEKAKQILFLGTPPETYDLEDLHGQVLERLRTSYAAELLKPDGPSNRLAAPSIPENGQLGRLMHCQSREGGMRDYWDIESRSIQTLASIE